jgi:hypothetical protein
MERGDERQTQDERALEREGGDEAAEEYTTYREVDGGGSSDGDAEARREADLQPAPLREGEEEKG